MARVTSPLYSAYEAGDFGAQVGRAIAALTERVEQLESRAALEERLLEAFLAGFYASGEGFNGEISPRFPEGLEEHLKRTHFEPWAEAKRPPA